MTNYLKDDPLVPILWQAIMNVVLAFSSTVAIVLLWDVSFSLAEAKIPKYMSIGVLCAVGVILPKIFDLAFVAIELNLTGKVDGLMILKLGKEAIMLICAIGGLALAVLKYVDDRKKVETKPT